VKEQLQDWYSKWLEVYRNTDLFWAKSRQLKQVHFVRDELVPLVRNSNRDSAEAYVIGEHRSKSVRLPVILLEHKNLKLVMRDNFHDWNLSVISEKPVPPDTMRGFTVDYPVRDKERFPNGYIKGNSWDYLFFQGFPEEFQFGPYSESPHNFSLCLSTDYQLYTFVWLLLRDL
jgi:hypothetical protein